MQTLPTPNKAQRIFRQLMITFVENGWTVHEMFVDKDTAQQVESNTNIAATPKDLLFIVAGKLALADEETVSKLVEDALSSGEIGPAKGNA